MPMHIWVGDSFLGLHRKGRSLEKKDELLFGMLELSLVVEGLFLLT